MQLVDVLGVRITAATIEELNEVVYTAVATKAKWILANHNLHSLYLFHHDHKLRVFFDRAKLAHVDGMALIVLSRILGYPLVRDQRVTYVDWIGPLMQQASDHGWRVFFVGGKPGVGETACETFRAKFPGAMLSVHHGYFDGRPGGIGNQEVLALINENSPHILMVGMGMPRQEHWILENLDMINANVILPVGACMDYVAGTVPTPPRWMGRLCLEWLYRLVCEPKRLARRYLIEPWFLSWLLLKQLLRKN